MTPLVAALFDARGAPRVMDASEALAVVERHLGGDRREAVRRSGWQLEEVAEAAGRILVVNRSVRRTTLVLDTFVLDLFERPQVCQLVASARQPNVLYPTTKVLLAPMPSSRSRIEELGSWRWLSSDRGEREERDADSWVLYRVSPPAGKKTAAHYWLAARRGTWLPTTCVLTAGSLAHAAYYSYGRVMDGDALWLRRVVFVERRSDGVRVVDYRLEDVRLGVRAEDLLLELPPRVQFFDHRTANARSGYGSLSQLPPDVRRWCRNRK